MIIKKTLNVLLAGTFFTAAGVSFGQQAPASAQQQLQPQGEERAQQAPRQDPAEMHAKMEEIRSEVEKISVRLSEIHQEALFEEDVRESLVEYETTFNEKIRDSAPGLEQQVEAHADVLESIAEFNGEGADMSSEKRVELASLLTQYNQLKQQLAPLESQLFNDPELLEARSEYQEEVISAMNEIEPNVEELIQKRMDLAQNFMALQQEMQQQHQPQGQAPQGQAPRQAPVR